MKYFERLEDSITHALIEEQIKLGYYPNAVSLYYPTDSVKKSLEVAGNENQEIELKQKLAGFCNYVEERLGKVGVHNLGERYRFVIPVEGVEYVHNHCGKQEFLSELIALTMRHDLEMEDIVAFFDKYADDLIVKHMDTEDFELAVYSPSHTPDKYVYCFKKEGHHMIYHRFTMEDFEQFGYTIENRY